jgi:hypothetical protein
MTNQTQMEPQALSRTEAIRRAVVALGYRTPVPEILEYVREHFGIGAERDQPGAEQAEVSASPVPTSPPEEAPSARPARRGKAK